MTEINFYTASPHSKNEIKIYIPGEKEEIIKISKDGFFYKGERIDDIHNVYERFNEWLSRIN